MASPLFQDDVKFLQQFLSCAGYNPKGIDGVWGPNTDAALQAFEAASIAIRTAESAFDLRSEGAIMTLHLPAQTAARRCLKAVLAAGFVARILSGTRTYAEQNDLYAIGRTKQLSKAKVTKARGGQSNHNFGIAWDLGLWVDGYYDGLKKPRDKALEAKAEQRYVDASAVVLGLGMPRLEWGGSWTSFQDKPHYQLNLGLSLADLRTKLANGTAYV